MNRGTVIALIAVAAAAAAVYFILFRGSPASASEGTGDTGHGPVGSVASGLSLMAERDGFQRKKRMGSTSAEREPLPEEKGAAGRQAIENKIAGRTHRDEGRAAFEAHQAPRFGGGSGSLPGDSGSSFSRMESRLRDRGGGGAANPVMSFTSKPMTLSGVVGAFKAEAPAPTTVTRKIAGGGRII